VFWCGDSQKTKTLRGGERRSQGGVKGDYGGEEGGALGDSLKTSRNTVWRGSINCAQHKDKPFGLKKGGGGKGLGGGGGGCCSHVIERRGTHESGGYWEGW